MWQDARRDAYERKEHGVLVKDGGCEGASGEICGRGNGNGDGALTESEWGIEWGIEWKDGTDGNEWKWTVPLQRQTFKALGGSDMVQYNTIRLQVSSV